MCGSPLKILQKKTNLIEPYNQGINVWITTKDIKKEDRLCNDIPTQGSIVQRVFFKFIPHFKIEHDITFEIF